MPSVITSINPHEHIIYPDTGSTVASCSANIEDFPSYDFNYSVTSPVLLSGRINIVFNESSKNPIINGDKKTFDNVQSFTNEELLSIINSDDYSVELPP